MDVFGKVENLVKVEDFFQHLHRNRYHLPEENLKEFLEHINYTLYLANRETIRYGMEEWTVSGTACGITFPCIEINDGEVYGTMYYQAFYGNGNHGNTRTGIQLVLFRNDLPDGHNMEILHYVDLDVKDRYNYFSSFLGLHEEPKLNTFWDKVKSFFGGW